MIRSMTGFGESELAVPAGRLRVELRTVNHRYLNVNSRLPVALSRWEPEIRAEGFRFSTDPELEATLLPDAANGPDADPEQRPVLRVVRTGEPILVPEVTPEVLDRLAHDEAHRERIRSEPRPLRS